MTTAAPAGIGTEEMLERARHVIRTEAASVAAWQGRRHGGYGAVREFAEALLEARGEWSDRVEAYVRDREAGL